MKDTSLKQIICTIYLAVLFVVYPLFQHDHYYDMGENKYKFYIISTIIFLVLLGIAIITDPDTYYKKGKGSNKKKNKNTKTKTKNASESKTASKKDGVTSLFMEWFGPKSIVEKFVWAYLLFAIISFIFGIDKYYGFFGADGWHMGLLIQCIMIACFFVYAKAWKPSWTPVYLAMAGSAVVMLLGIVMRFGIDPLGNYEGLDAYYISSFNSTIGQSSWYSSYMCTVLPVGVALYYITKDSKVRVVSGLYTCLSFCALIMQDSDSAYIAIAGIYLVMLWVAFRNREYLARLVEIAVIMFGSFVFMGFVRRSLEYRFNGDPESISLKIADNKLIIVAFVIMVVIRAILAVGPVQKVCDKAFDNVKVLNIVRTVLFSLIALMVVAVIAFVPLNTKGVFGEPIYNSFLYFDEMWGNRRGASWRACWMIFSDYSIFRKLIGIGPDSLAIVTQYNDTYRTILDTVFASDNVLTCAHNEFFNAIVVYGLLGGIAYIGIFVSSIIRFVKESKVMPIIIAGAICVAAYCGHNVFCYQTVICTPFILVIIGICESVLNDIKG